MKGQRFLSSFKNNTVLRKPNLDIKRIINESDRYKESLLRRQQKNLIPCLEYVLQQKPTEHELTIKINHLRHERSSLGESLMKRNSPVDKTKQRLTEIKKELKELEGKRDILAGNIHLSAESLPNLLDPTVPHDSFNEEVVKYINCESEKDAATKKPPLKFSHKEICEKLDIVDFIVGSRVSGSSWYYMKGDGALLEQALIQYGLAKAREHGYIMIVPPSVVHSEIVDACGFKPNDQNGEQQVYNIADSNLSLIGTAEIPLGALHSSSTFPSHQQFPVKYVGISRSYRAEAGARGADTKGLYRVHEFSKVELFHFTTPEKASQELEEIQKFQISFVEGLGLMAKVLNMPTSDLGAPAMKKYDCEAWMPGRKNWGEITSCSNCGDYQSRRLGIKYEDPTSGKQEYVYTLNGTCVAVPRVIIAIVEQFYDAETHSVIIPQVLRKYMDNKERILLTQI